MVRMAINYFRACFTACLALISRTNTRALAGVVECGILQVSQEARSSVWRASILCVLVLGLETLSLAPDYL